MKTLVVMGGPCAGKTSAVPYVRECLEQAGFTVIVVPEAGADLILDTFNQVGTIVGDNSGGCRKICNVSFRDER